MSEFPSCIILDSFIRAEENPLKNGEQWTAAVGATDIGAVKGEGYKANQSPPLRSGAVWNPKKWVEPAVEITVPTLGGAGAERFVKLGFMTELAANTGYKANFEETAVAGKWKFFLEIWKANTPTKLKENIEVVVANGNKLGFWCTKGKLQCLVFNTEWKLVGEIADANFKEGFVLIEASGINPKFTNFGAAGVEPKIGALGMIL